MGAPHGNAVVGLFMISKKLRKKITQAESEFKAGNGVNWRNLGTSQKKEIDDLLTETTRSGKPTPMTRKDWARIRTNGLTVARKRRDK